MSDKRFGTQWDEFARRILPRNASPIQVQETRRAFYAGGAALFGAVMSMLDPGVEPTDEDLRKMDELDEEFRAFQRDLAEGRA